jgi:6-phosphogluconolactonase
MMIRTFVLLFSLCGVSSVFAETLVYVGTYTRGSSEGIYVSRFNPETGELSEPVLAAEAENPSFVALHPTRPLLYAVSEVSSDGPDSVGIMAFAINDDGTLRKLNERPSGGGAACHVAVDPTGQCVGVANYSGGSCALFPILDDGSLGAVGSLMQHVGGSGANPNRQNSPHAHAINFNADGTQAFVNDLGKDQVLIYDVNPKTAKMKPSKQPFLQLPAGGGPRHFCFEPSHQVAVANLEMTSRVAVLDYDGEKGSLRSVVIRDTIPEADREMNNSTAECLVHPSGRYVYVSNRGHNSIAAFRLDVSSQKLVYLGNTSTEGKIPRGFGIDPTGQYLVVGNQNSGNVVTLKIDAATGKLSPTGHSVLVDGAVNVRFYDR